MPKADEKNKVPKRANKMASPTKGVRPFNFPAHNVTIEASDIREAESKLKETLKPKLKQDD